MKVIFGYEFIYLQFGNIFKVFRAKSEHLSRIIFIGNEVGYISCNFHSGEKDWSLKRRLPFGNKFTLGFFIKVDYPQVAGEKFVNFLSHE